MSDDSLALKIPFLAPPSEADYAAMCATMVETERGRWFLTEYARRNRNADTEQVLAAIAQVEAAIRGTGAAPSPDSMRADVAAMAEAIARTRAELSSIATQNADTVAGEAGELPPLRQATTTAVSEILGAAEQIRDTVWAMRDRDFANTLCDQLLLLATRIDAAGSSLERADRWMWMAAALLDHLDRTMRGLVAPSEADAAPAEVVTVADEPMAVAAPEIPPSEPFAAEPTAAEPEPVSWSLPPALEASEPVVPTPILSPEEPVLQAAMDEPVLQATPVEPESQAVAAEPALHATVDEPVPQAVVEEPAPQAAPLVMDIGLGAAAEREAQPAPKRLADISAGMSLMERLEAREKLRRELRAREAELAAAAAVAAPAPVDQAGHDMPAEVPPPAAQAGLESPAPEGPASDLLLDIDLFATEHEPPAHPATDPRAPLREQLDTVRAAMVSLIEKVEEAENRRGQSGPARPSNDQQA